MPDPYPEISRARRVCSATKRALRRAGTDPAQARRSEKAARPVAAAQTFEVVALLWLDKTKAERADSRRREICNWLRNDNFPSDRKDADR